MKNSFLIACAVALLSACSGPSYYLIPATKSAYHGDTYKVAPVAAHPEQAAPLEAGTETIPAMLPPFTSPEPVQQSAPARSQQLPVPNQANGPADRQPAAERTAPLASIQKNARKFSPKKIIQQQRASNTNIALIFLISGALVILLLKSVLAHAVLIGVGLLILGVVFLFI